MLFRGVARDDPPDCSSYDSDGGAEPEGRSPTVMRDQPVEQRRCESAARSDASEDETVDESAFVDGNPTGDELVGGREHDGFADAEREADADQEQNGVRDGWGQQG